MLAISSLLSPFLASLTLSIHFSTTCMQKTGTSAVKAKNGSGDGGKRTKIGKKEAKNASSQ